MNIYEVTVQDYRGSRPDQNVITQRVWGITPQEAVDKVRKAINITKETKYMQVVTVSQIVKMYNWE